MSLMYKDEIDRCYDVSRFRDRIDLLEHDGLKIPFLKDARNILIWMSGGADSACLTHIICDYIRKNDLKVTIHVLQFIRKWNKAPWQEKIAFNVYNHFVNEYPEIKFVRHSTMIPVCIEGQYIADRKTLAKKYDTYAEIMAMNEIAQFVTVRNGIDINYNAITRNPPIEFDYRVLERDIVCTGSDDDSDRLLGSYKPSMSLFANPFMFTDKSWILKQYKDMQLIDLLNKTRSCESYVDGVDFTNWDGNQDNLEDCNTECFWCFERNWALEVNGLLEFKDKHGKIRLP